MKQKEGFVLRTVCGEHVIVGEGLGTIDFGKLISLNETAAWLWEKAGEMGDFDIDSLSAALCEEYEVEAGKAHDDVAKMVAKWQEIGIVE
ncbi:MAG: PqqD family protein [Prevotella sp.]|nr:PqqD family protein [Prevotella sp.]